MVRRSRKGVSNSIAGAAIVVVLVIAALAGYFLTNSGTASTTSTSSTSTSLLTTSSSSSALSSSTTTTTSSSTFTTSVASTVMNDLASAAQAECAASTTGSCLTIYTTQDAGNWQEYYGPAFDAQFPWAAGKVNYISWSQSDETTHVLSDYATHQVEADIVDGTLAGLIPDYQGGAFMNYTSPEAYLMNYSSDAIGPAWIQQDLAIVHMVYNPTVLAKDHLPVPQNWSALASPIYKNNIAFQSGTALSITTAEFYYLYTQLGNASWTALMKGIAANNPMITGAAGDAESDVLNGYAAIGIDTIDSYVTALQGDPNAPLKIVDIEPMVYTPGVLAITNGTPHPAMAKLVEAWFISSAGQKAIAQTNHLPYQTSLGADVLSYLPSDYVLRDAYSTYQQTALFQNTGGWSDTFKTIFGA